MKEQLTYFLLRKNNSLQTFESLIRPYVYSSNDKDEILRIKQQLELAHMRETPIHFHFDHLAVDCDKEVISFDKFLFNNYGFSFLATGFNHTQNNLNGQILYEMKFPKHLTDEALIIIQKRMDKYHFILTEQEANNKVIILLNPQPIENPLRDGEIFKFQEFFDTKNQAQNFIDKIIEGQFDLDGSYMTVGNIQKNELTERTRQLLNSNYDFQFKAGHEENGNKFVSSSKLNDIVNGMDVLLKLYDSVGKYPYKIIELK